MNAFKKVSFLSFILLAACAPPKSSIVINPLTSPTTLKNEKTTQIEQPTKLNELVPGKISKLETTKTDLNDKAADSKQVGHAAVPSSWDLSGAIAARSKSKAWSASINWLQRGSGTYQIRLLGPLGGGSVLIEKQGGVITFKDGAKTSSSSNAEELLNQQTGIRLPVNNLYYWVRGIPAPGAVQSEKRDQNNRLISLHQAGYTIDYQAYNKAGKTVLPTQIRLQGNGVFIKLAIKNWKF